MCVCECLRVDAPLQRSGKRGFPLSVKIGVSRNRQTSSKASKPSLPLSGAPLSPRVKHTWGGHRRGDGGADRRGFAADGGGGGRRHRLCHAAPRADGLGDAGGGHGLEALLGIVRRAGRGLGRHRGTHVPPGGGEACRTTMVFATQPLYRTSAKTSRPLPPPKRHPDNALDQRLTDWMGWEIGVVNTGPGERVTSRPRLLRGRRSFSAVFLRWEVESDTVSTAVKRYMKTIGNKKCSVWSKF